MPTLEQYKATPLWDKLNPEQRKKFEDDYIKMYQDKPQPSGVMAAKPSSTDFININDQTRAQLEGLIRDPRISPSEQRYIAGKLAMRDMEPWQMVMAGLGKTFYEPYAGAMQLIMGGDEASLDASYGRALTSEAPGMAGSMVGMGMLGALAPQSQGLTALTRLKNAAGQAAVGAGYEGVRATAPEESRGLNVGIQAVLPFVAELVQAVGAKAINTITGKLTHDKYRELVDAAQKYGVRLGFADLPGQTKFKPWSRIAERIPIVGSRSWRIFQAGEGEVAAKEYAEALLPPGVSFDNPIVERHNEIINSVKNLYTRRKVIQDEFFAKVKGAIGKLPKKEQLAHAPNLNQQLTDMLYEHPTILNDMNLPTSMRNAFAGVLKKSQITIKDAAGNNISANFPVTAESLMNLDKAINAQLRKYKGVRSGEAETARHWLNKIKTSVRDDLDAWVHHMSRSPKAVTTQKQAVIDAWQAAKSYHRNKIAPIKNNNVLWRMINDEFEPSRAITQWIKRDAPEVFSTVPSVSNRKAGIMDAMDIRGRQTLKGEIMNRVIQSSTKGGVFHPGSFANNLEKMLGESVEGLFNNTERAELMGLKNLLRHIDMSGVAASSKGGELGGFFTGIPGGMGAAIAAAGWEGLKAAGKTVFATLGFVRLLTSNSGRRFLTAAWRLQPGTKSMDNLATRANSFIHEAVAKGLVEKLNDDKYIESLYQEQL